MQKKKKIQKNRDLRDGLRAQLGDAHQERLEAIVEAARTLERPHTEEATIVARNSGSFVLSEKVEIARQTLAAGRPVTIVATVKASETAVRLVEMIKEALGVRAEQVSGKVGEQCRVVFVIRGGS